jgi:hypothetical protein
MTKLFSKRVVSTSSSVGKEKKVEKTLSTKNGGPSG